MALLDMILNQRGLASLYSYPKCSPRRIEIDAQMVWKGQSGQGRPRSFMIMMLAGMAEAIF